MEDKLTVREWLPLIGMTCAVFMFNTSEFMPIGLLSTISEDFGMTEAATGHIVSLYAYVVMILSMPLMVLASKYSLRSLILTNLVLFVISNALASLAADFWTLLGARLVLACAHSVFWSIATPVAVRLVKPRFKKLAMSMLVAGGSLAIILGMPVGRIIGLQLGWRMSFLAVSIVAAVLLVYMLAVFPKLTKSEPFSFKQLPELLKNKILLGIYAITALIPTAQYTAYSYIEPFMKYVAAMPEDMITMSLMIIGFAGILGSVLFSKLYDGWAKFFMPASLLGMAGLQFSLYALAVQPYILIVACVCWGALMTAFCMASQAELLQTTTVSSAPVAMSMYSGIFNFGIGSGTWLGGRICDYSGIAYVGHGAGTVAILGMLVSVWLTKKIYWND